MPGIFIYSEDDAVARQLLSAGLSLKAAMNVPIVRRYVERRTRKIHRLRRRYCRRVLKAPNAWPEALGNAIADLVAKEPSSVLLVGATLRGKDIAARVAARLNAGLSSDAQSVKFADGAIETSRLLYCGLAVSEEVLSLPAVVTIPPRTFPEPAPGERKGEVKTVEVEVDTRIAIGDVCPVEREGVDISTASKIVSVGRGLRDKADLHLAQDLAKALKAEIACTRGVAEDYHWLPIERYIGISGQKVKPDIYLGVGVSGQVQHVVGMRESKCIVAVNTDEKAPIFEAADYGIVGDLYEVLPLLTAALNHP